MPRRKEPRRFRLTPLGPLPGRTGGGPIQNGLELLSGYSVRVEDPDVPFDVELEVVAHDGRLTCRRLEVLRRADSDPGVTLRHLKRLALDSYLAASLAASPLGPGVVTPTDDGGIAWEPAEPEQELALVRKVRRPPRPRPPSSDLQRVADLWLEAQELPDYRHRPTVYVAERLGPAGRPMHRVAASRRVSEARAAGLLPAYSRRRPPAPEDTP